MMTLEEYTLEGIVEAISLTDGDILDYSETGYFENGTEFQGYEIAEAYYAKLLGHDK